MMTTPTPSSAHPSLDGLPVPEFAEHSHELLRGLELMPRVQSLVLALCDRVAMVTAFGDFKKLIELCGGKGDSSMPDALFCAELLGLHSAGNSLGDKITGPLLRTVKGVTFTSAIWHDEARQIFRLQGEARIEDDRDRKSTLRVTVLARVVPGQPPTVKLVSLHG